MSNKVGQLKCECEARRGTTLVAHSPLKGSLITQEGKGEHLMKPTIRVLVAMCLVVLLSAGTALAALPRIVGTNSGEQINGTKNAEEIHGLEGSDEISDGLGADLVYGGTGGDNLIGTASDT